ncbi:uncharacterized protein LOC132804382 [Ziziphus jujuba]|uniref:Uncharacterized protein LOC132804382 n=1 Tax=Ziziphus jujuba TaxID=326968 RepID=A0ABM4AD45_ZIZJJ|nr:uncharacterized protein LOC132804382 [Ziziphus jujuba]
MDHFLEVILRDSCFIFELLLRNFENLLHDTKQDDITDYILRTPWLIDCIGLDLIMLENQLPYFVFTKLFEFILENQHENLNNIPPYLSKNQNESERHHFIMKMTCEFFNGYYYFYGKVTTSESIRSISQCFQDIKHFTNLVRQFMCPNNYVASSEFAGCRYSTKELDKGRVDFVPCANKFLTDIKFNKEGNILKVPRFLIGDNTVPHEKHHGVGAVSSVFIHMTLISAIIFRCWINLSTLLKM